MLRATTLELHIGREPGPAEPASLSPAGFKLLGRERGRRQAAFLVARVKSLRSAASFELRSVQRTRSLHPFLVVCGPCALPALKCSEVPAWYCLPSLVKSPSTT